MAVQQEIGADRVLGELPTPGSRLDHTVIHDLDGHEARCGRVSGADDNTRTGEPQTFREAEVCEACLRASRAARTDGGQVGVGAPVVQTKQPPSSSVGRVLVMLRQRAKRASQSVRERLAALWEGLRQMVTGR